MTRLIIEHVKDVVDLMSTLPANYELAMLQGMGTSWLELDEPSE